LSERLNLHVGQVVDMGGNNIGTVDAVELVTVGQRKGLKLGGNVGRSYAVEVDIPSRRVVAGSAQDLLSETVELRDHFWIGPEYQGSVAVQTSAHGDPAAAHLNADGSVQWAQARRKVAPGQAVVFYLDDAVIGGAIAC
jgi:tRNA-specific 2-thiouridylase